MATDVKKHTVPGLSDTPRMGAINDLGLSIRDFVPVADVTARAQLVTDLESLDAGPSTDNPLVVFRADATPGREIEYTTNGSTWRVLAALNETGWVALTLSSGFTGALVVKYVNSVGYVRGIVTGTIPNGAQTQVASGIPVEARPLENAAGATLWPSGGDGGDVCAITTAGNVFVRNTSGSSKTGATVSCAWIN